MRLRVTRARAHYRIVRQEINRVVIRDLGPWDEHPTVTNDAEAVLEDLLASHYLRPGMQLFYFDCEGACDEIRFDAAGKFIGFAPGAR